MKQFEGKVALVTGGSNGIGRATAVAFARAGAKVAIADWKGVEDNETVRTITGFGGTAAFFKCDVSLAADVASMTAAVIERFGRIDFAFNNAGIEGENAITHECTEDNWDRVISINLKGVWLCMQQQIKVMQTTGAGVIINCSSVAGLKGFAGLPAYVASKHGVAGVTKAAALEYSKMGIRVNAICPGVIHTEMIDRLTKHDKKAEDQYAQMQPLGRMGTPDEIAEAVTWLCSDEASFVTGICMPLDGGIMAG